MLVRPLLVVPQLHRAYCTKIHLVIVEPVHDADNAVCHLDCDSFWLIEAIGICGEVDLTSTVAVAILLESLRKLRVHQSDQLRNILEVSALPESLLCCVLTCPALKISYLDLVRLDFGDCAASFGRCSAISLLLSVRLHGAS